MRFRKTKAVMKNIAVLATGRGTNFKSLCRAGLQKQFPGKIALLVAGRENIGALDVAEEFNIPRYVLDPKHFPSQEQYNTELEALLSRFDIHWIALAGWLRKIAAELIEKYPNRIVNIHPALLPFFGGRGMYGMHVHRAVWESGMLVSGATVHFVDEQYDHGAIIMQQCVALSPEDKADDIARKVLRAEHELFPKALKRILSTPYTVKNNRVCFKPGA